MKITALLVMKCDPERIRSYILAKAFDVSHFRYFQRSGAHLLCQSYRRKSYTHILTNLPMHHLNRLLETLAHELDNKHDHEKEQFHYDLNRSDQARTLSSGRKSPAKPQPPHLQPIHRPQPPPLRCNHSAPLAVGNWSETPPETITTSRHHQSSWLRLGHPCNPFNSLNCNPPSHLS